MTTRLTAFLKVRQRWTYRRMTAVQIVERINQVHSKAAIGTIHNKVLALWEMEGLGYAWGAYLDRPEYLLPVLIESAIPIVLVGYGAGSVAQHGFDSDKLRYASWKSFYPHYMYSWEGDYKYFWEGVGHMLYLSAGDHWIVARLLGVPIIKNHNAGVWIASLPINHTKSVWFGYNRMHWLSTGRGSGTLGAQFAEAILRHREWRRVELPGEAPAREFIQKVWP